jgi:3-deoxy-D-manno-octulosonic-acid transferase
MALLFDMGSALYHAGVRVAAAWDPKARAWVDGRKGLWARLEAKAETLRGCLWMHCASVGEFEQGRPVLEAIKAAHPELPVLLTFFSPSGYEARKDEPLATHVDYLPPDGPANAQRLLDLIAPRAAVFVKYEFWYHHLHALKRAGIPAFLISALFRDDQPFFRWFGRDWRSMVGCFTAIGTQDERSKELLHGIGARRAQVTGDTRYDRVLTIRATAAELPLAAAFTGKGSALVLGSTWPPDEALLIQALEGKAVKCIIAPHELGDDQLAAIEQRFTKPLVRWSELEATSPENVERTLGREPKGTLLVDRMGLLSRLYRYGAITYVGGGFSDGIHNLLEAAVWGCPVLFGPKHRKFPEAMGLIQAGGGFEVRNADEARRVLSQLMQDEAARAHAAAQARAFVERGAGATTRVMAMLSPYLRD